MLFTMNTKARPDDHRTAFSFGMICLMAVLMTAAAGCASVPLYRTHPELPQRKNAIRSVGLLPPMITMYEERPRFKLVPHDEWAPEAAEAVRKAFIDEMAAIRVPLVAISGEDRELNDMLDLFSAVDFSIQRHVYDTNLKETFPEKTLSFDYSLGPARETMERHSVDAVWIVTSYNLLHTVGAQFVDAILMLRHVRLELRAALVDKNGTILFYCKLNDLDYQRLGQNPDQFDVSKGEHNPNEAEEWPVKEDLRDARTARQYIRALISEYRKAVAR